MESKFFSFSNIKSLFFENKTLKQTILKNTFWLWVAEVIDKGIAFLIAILLARHFGAIAYGQWSFAMSFVSLFFIFADFGFSALIVREISKDKSKTTEYIDNMLAMKVVLGMIVFGFIVFFISFFNKDPSTISLVYFLGAFIVVNTFTLFFRSVFQANEKMQYETACRIVQSLILLIFVIVLILNKYSIITISIAYLFSAIISFFIFSIVVWHYFAKFFKKINIKICKEILIEAWPFAFNGLFAVLYSQVDTIMLSAMKTDLAVGWYNAAITPITGLLIIPGLFMAAIYPKLSNTFLSSKSTFIKLYKNSLKYLFILGIILFLILFIFADSIILLLYGASYAEAVIIFRILLLSNIFIFLSYVLSYVLYATGKQIVYTRILATCLVFNIALNFLLIPKYSYIGASIAFVIPQLFLCLLLFLSVRKTLRQTI